MYEIFDIYLRQDQVRPNCKDLLLVGEVLPWLSLLWLLLQKSMQLAIFVFVEAQEIILRGNLQSSKRDGDCIFLIRTFFIPS